MESNEAPKMVFTKAYFGEGEYVIAVRPEEEKAWNEVPIGCTLMASEANSVAKWIRSAWPELYKIACNLKAIEDNKHGRKSG